jgi:hypothetical protein
MTVSVSMQRWAFLGLLLLLTSCGGGGTGGSGSPVVASGSVTDFGSIVVTGITFNTEDATITVNGQPGSEADLRLGHVVTVRGTLEPGGLVGTADTVVFESNVKGPITSIDVDDNRLVVLGQLVLVDDATQFGATQLHALVVGNIVEVSGFLDADGALRATRIDKTQDAFMPGIEIEVEGPITDLDEANQTFTLNMLQVDFSMAQLLNLPGDGLRNGQVVEVKSTQNVGVVTDGLVLVADSVAVKDVRIQGDPGDAVELQGIVTCDLSADNTFEVNGQAVRLTSDTVFEAGTAANIAVDVRIEVEGVFDADGIIVAEEVELGAGIEFQGIITQGLSADNTFVVDAQRVRLTVDTVFIGGMVSDIAVGVPVEVEGAFTADGVLVAAVIDFFVDLEGIVTQGLAADNTFEVDGQRVRVTDDTVFEGGTETNITIGMPVEVEGRFDEDNVLVATEIEFLSSL